LVITRVDTSSMSALVSRPGAAVVAALLTTADDQDENKYCCLTHFLSPSIRQTEFNSHARRKIHWLAFRFAGLNLICCAARVAAHPNHGRDR